MVSQHMTLTQIIIALIKCILHPYFSLPSSIPDMKGPKQQLEMEMEVERGRGRKFIVPAFSTAGFILEHLEPR